MRDSFAMQNGQASGRTFVVGLLCGAAIGTAVGLLLAPKSGEELRGDIADTADRIKKTAGDTYARASAAVSDLAGKGRDAFRRGRETFEDARAEAAREMAAVE